MNVDWSRRRMLAALRIDYPSDGGGGDQWAALRHKLCKTRAWGPYSNVLRGPPHAEPENPPRDLPLPQFGRVVTNFRNRGSPRRQLQVLEYTITLVLPGTAADGRQVRADKWALKTWGRFWQACHLQLGLAWPPKRQFKHHPRAQAWLRHQTAQMDIGERLEAEFHIQMAPVQARYSKATEQAEIARRMGKVWESNRPIVEPQELKAKYVTLRADVRSIETGLDLAIMAHKDKLLDELWHEERAAEQEMYLRWERMDALAEQNYKDATVKEREEYSQGLKQVLAWLEQRRLVWNAQLPKPKPPRASVKGRSPGKPPAQRQRAVELLQQMLPAMVADVVKAAEENRIMFKTIEAAAKKLGVRKVPVGRNRRWVLPDAG